MKRLALLLVFLLSILPALPVAGHHTSQISRYEDGRNDIAVIDNGAVRVARGPTDILSLEVFYRDQDVVFLLEVADLDRPVHPASLAPGGEKLEWRMSWGTIEVYVTRSPDGRLFAIAFYGPVVDTSRTSTSAVLVTFDMDANLVQVVLPGLVADLDTLGAHPSGVFAFTDASPCDANGGCHGMADVPEEYALAYGDRLVNSLTTVYHEGTSCSWPAYLCLVHKIAPLHPLNLLP